MLSNKLEKFDMKDIHSGYVVKFRNGNYALCMRVGSRRTNGDYKPIKIFARVDDNAQMTGAQYNNTYVYAHSYDGPDYYPYLNDRKVPCPEFDIVAVYGLIEHCRNYLNIGDTGPISIKNRPILWEDERPIRRMTLKEIEKSLGYRVEIVAEKKTVHYKNEETCNKCKYQRCGDRLCGDCKLNCSEGCMCFHVAPHTACSYFEEK